MKIHKLLILLSLVSCGLIHYKADNDLKGVANITKKTDTANHGFKKCILKFCFMTDVPKIDSQENSFTGPVDNATSYGHFLQVYDVCNDSLNILIQECKDQRYMKLPLPDYISFPILKENYLKPSDSGYFNLTFYHNGIYTRLELLNLTQKKYVLFISNG